MTDPARRLNMEDIIHELSMAERARKPMAQLGRVFEDEFPIVDKVSEQSILTRAADTSQVRIKRRN